MPALRLPENATSILDQAHVNVPDSYEDKWLLYNIAPECSDDDVCELFQTAVREHGGFQPEEEESEKLGWCWPAETEGHELRRIQDVLQFHFGIVSKRIAGESAGQRHFAYEFGFVVMTSSEWREKGVIAVHLDRDRGKWKVTRCCLPLNELGLSLTSISDNDESFDTVREDFQHTDENQRIISEDNHTDNQGGAVPEGAWKFMMYSTMKPMGEVQHAIPDPRGESFGFGEECFMAVSGRMSNDEVLECFPVSYGRFVKGQEQPESRKRMVARRHPELFVVVDNEAPAERGALIVRMLWDWDVDRSEDELKRVGRESRTETQRCDVNSLVDTLEHLSASKSLPC